MNKFRCFIALFCFFFASAFFLKGQDWQGYQSPSRNVELLQDPGVGDSDVHRFFLLKTGYLVEGKAVHTGTRLEVQTEYGFMQIPLENLEFAAENREDIYQHKKLQIDPRNCTQLMKLADWCLTNQLVEEGIAEYRRAEQIAPNGMLADLIREQIAQAENPSAEPTRRNPFAPPKRVSASKEAEDDLGLWINSVPQALLDSFSKKVQPVLVSRCAAAECHGSNSENQFKISIPRQPNGRSAYLNMKSSVQWIDLENPKTSPLLTALISQHGGKKPLYNVESSQYQNFVDWIQLTGKNLPPELNASLQAQLRERRRNIPMASNPTEPSLLPDRFQETMLGRQHGAGAPPSFFAQQNGKDDSTVNYTPTRLVVPDAAAPVSATASAPYAAEAETDPFNPDLFNARFHEKVWKGRQK